VAQWIRHQHKALPDFWRKLRDLGERGNPTQNLVRFTPSVGSTPTSGTISLRTFVNLDRARRGLRGCCPCKCPYQPIELLPSVDKIALTDDVIAVEHGARLVPSHAHSDYVRDTGAHEITYGGASEVVRDAAGTAGAPTCAYPCLME
jgi:hypothetical protein